MSRHVEECSYFSTVINNLIMATDTSHSCQLNGNIAAKHWVYSSLFCFLLPSPPPSWMSVYSPRPRQAWGILNSWQKSTMCCNTFIPTLILCVGVFLNGKGVSLRSLAYALVSSVCLCVPLCPQQCGWNRNYTRVGAKAETEEGESIEAGQRRL